MNKKGNPSTLIAAHPGNSNAAKSGVHSPRVIAARASEIFDELGIVDKLDEPGRVVLAEVARLMALIEAIDRDLDERGLTDREGKERYLLQRRERYSRRLMEANDRLLDARSRQVRKPVGLSDDVVGEPRDYVRQLQAIALGHDPEARVSERLLALKLLTGMGAQGASSFYERTGAEVPFPDDAAFQAKVAQLEQDLEVARKKGFLAKLRSQIDMAEFAG